MEVLKINNLKSIFFILLFISGSIGVISCDRREGEDESAYEMDPGEEMALDAYETEVHELEQLDNLQTMERFPDDQFEYPARDMIVGGNPSLVMDDEEFSFGMDDPSLEVVGDGQEEEDVEEGLELQTQDDIEGTESH